jgi:hypothetical protein
MRHRFAALAALVALAIAAGGFVAIQSLPHEEVSEWRATREQREVLLSLRDAQEGFYAEHGRLARDADELALVGAVEVPVCVSLEWELTDEGRGIRARTVHPKASVTCSLKMKGSNGGDAKCVR